MNLYNTVLALHIATAAMVMMIGPVSMFSRKRKGIHTKSGELYHWLMLGTCLCAAALATLAWARIWWFLPVAVGSYAFAFVGYVAAKIRGRGWLAWHIIGMGGSYIALVTALGIVNWHTVFGTSGIQSPVAWLWPTVVGSPLIAYVVAKWTRPKIKPAGLAAGANPAL